MHICEICSIQSHLQVIGACSDSGSKHCSHCVCNAVTLVIYMCTCSLVQVLSATEQAVQPCCWTLQLVTIGLQSYLCVRDSVLLHGAALCYQEFRALL